MLWFLQGRPATGAPYTLEKLRERFRERLGLRQLFVGRLPILRISSNLSLNFGFLGIGKPPNT
ncbi:hypothetical protein MPL3356_170110 [Mesorhizobium plurifarium]|uniref:Uncharacterized protein n=1 Tax=Mesorhizobium plurifarium TaxID=69974 RepID=A0A090DH42_MESPL|nr:hypothetical protein MPL3356_170110 [Mesorhizobium plurifarium]